MKKRINEENRKMILNILEKYGINKMIINTARNMDLSLEELFYDNIILSSGKRNDDIVTTSLLGVYGNCYASYYFKGLGYIVENEKPVYDSKNNITTKADVSFIDKNGTQNYCEVKTAFQIIDNIRNYIDPDENTSKKKCYTDKDQEIIKYKSIGKKLIRQVKKLSLDKTKKVNVVIFSGCYVDDIIRNKLKKMNVNLITLNTNINDLYIYVNDLLQKIKGELSKPKIKFFPYKITNNINISK